MVSPVDKNGIDIDSTSGGSLLTFSLNRAARSGGAVAFNSRGAFAGAGGSVYSQYLARRVSSGWVTDGLNPPLQPVAGILVNPAYQWLSDELSFGITSTVADFGLGESTPYNLYRENLQPRSYELLTRTSESIPPQDPALIPYGRQAVFTGASEDGSHIVFEDDRQLTADAPPSGSQLNLFEREGELLRLVSVMPDGAAATFGDIQAGGHGVASGRNGDPGAFAVSEDGSHIFFTVGQQLLVRVDGKVTRRVSASEVDGSSEDDGLFQLADPTGRWAIFLSSGTLSDDDTAPGGAADLYRWDGDAPAGSRLTDLTTADPNGGGVLGVAGSSRDASVVYFAATGALTPEATLEEPSLYRWAAGNGITHITELDGSGSGFLADEAIWTFSRSPDTTASNDYKGARVSSDGNRILFVSSAKVTDYENAGHRQIYLYDSSDEALTCVSCSSLTAESTGDASLLTDIPTPDNLPMAAPFLPRNLSSDGSRVWFDSPEALVPADSNGAIDVYEWADGDVRLISSGQGGGPSKFVDASANGGDVFFTTYQQLVGWDRDEFADIYDARVAGGFPEPAVNDVCEGDTCQGTLTMPPDDIQPGTATLHSAGGRALGKAKPRRCSKKRHRVRRNGKVRCIKREGRDGRGGTANGKAHR